MGEWCHTIFVTYLRGSKNLTRRETGVGGGGEGVVKHLNILVNQR